MSPRELPDKIIPDAIIEALVDFRIEHNELPELVVGRLLDAEMWKGYFQSRLPAADISLNPFATWTATCDTSLPLNSERKMERG